jgi:oligosaccharyltransferase complex subunit alpha (ribophorin I)
MRFISALSALIATAVATLAFDPTAYENTQIQRTYELGGATTNVQTVYTVRALKENPGGYELVLKGPEEQNEVEGTDYWEVVQGGKTWDSLIVSSASDGYVERFKRPVSRTKAVLSRKTVTIPLEASDKEPITFTLSQVLVHRSHPLPTSIGQDDEQFLMFESNVTMVESLYPTTGKETVKYR